MTTRMLRLAVLVLTYAVAVPCATTPQVAVPGPLHVGDPFPRLAGESLAGTAIAIPAIGAGAPTVVVLSFSRKGGADAQQWAERLTADPLRGETNVLVVAELQTVPRLLRGAVSYAIRRRVPTALRERTLILDHDDAVWRQRLAVESTERSYAVLVDSSGKVRWLSSGARDDNQIAQLRAAIRALRVENR